MFVPRVLALLVAIAVVTPSYGKIFTRCELAKELVKQGFPRFQMSGWVCVVEAGTKGTRSTSHVTTTSELDVGYGLFQVNGMRWCARVAGETKECDNLPCTLMLNDDITDDSVCAKLIYKTLGFEAWKANCNGFTWAKLRIWYSLFLCQFGIVTGS